MENTMTQKPREQTSAYRSVEDADRLDSWKEIARYLNRDVRTIQRWETFESLPIHRHFHRKSGTVYGFKTEIDAWCKDRSYRESVDREQELRPTVHFEHYSVPIETQTLRELLVAALTEFIAQSSIFVATLAPGAQAKERIAVSSQGPGGDQEGCGGNHLQSHTLLPNMQ